MPERPAALVADAAGGWPRVVSTKTDKDKPVRIAHRKHHKQLAQRDEDAKSTRHAKHVVKADSDDDAKPARQRKLAAHKDKDDAVVTAAIAKKKRKPQTAEQDKGFNSLWR